MVISVIGMAICLLCSCRQDKNEAKTESRQEQEAGLENAGSENMGLEDAGLEEPEEEEPDYRTCMSGTVVEQELTGEEISSLFYAQEIPQEVFARMDGVSYVENEDIALGDLRYLRLLYVGFD